MRSTMVLPLASLLLALTPTAGDAQDNCRDVLRAGVWEEHESQLSERSREEFRHYIQSMSRSGRIRTRNVGNQTQLITESGLPIGNQFSWSDGTATEKLSQMAQSTEWTDEHERFAREFHRVASPEIVRAWGDCMRRSGVHVTAIQKGPGQYLVVARYVQGAGPITRPRVRDVLPNPLPNRVTCDVRDFSGEEVGAGELTMECTNRSTRIVPLRVRLNRGFGDYYVDLVNGQEEIVATPCSTQQEYQDDRWYSIPTGTGCPGISVMQAGITYGSAGHLNRTTVYIVRPATRDTIRLSVHQEEHCAFTVGRHRYALIWSASRPATHHARPNFATLQITNREQPANTCVAVAR